MLQKFLITNEKVTIFNELRFSLQTEQVEIFSNAKFNIWENENKKFFLIGNFLKKINKSEFENKNNIKNIEGSFVLIIYEPVNKKFEIYNDKFSTKEIFYQENDGKFKISSNLDFFELDKSKFEYDQFGIAQSFVIYGARPSKKNTFYKNVKRLGYYENIEIVDKAFSVKSKLPNINRIEKYENEHLEKYSNTFIEIIKKNSSNEENVIYLSSGWDSTSILAALYHIYGNKKIRCIICKLNYSKKYGITNKFEIDKAKKICDFYNIKLEIIENNYVEKQFVNHYFEKLQQPFRSMNFNLLAGINHYILAEQASKFRSSSDTVVFSGEMSDGAHNLGFSQYFTIFHPKSFVFREYSDKMMSYLFGPTFLKQIIDGKFLDDPVWKILFNHFGSPKIESTVNKNQLELKELFLKSFFIQNTRFPLTSIESETFLSENGKQKYEKYMLKNYISEYAKNLEYENLYGIFLDLYNSFHWQGSTVATIRHTAELFNLKVFNPFHSPEIIDFLSSMPENWGRGLDLNSTKYPLKYMLKNKLKYPYEIQDGPHSYLYDIDESFNHSREVLLNSAVSDYLKLNIKKNKLLNSLNNEILNKDYIFKIVNKFLNNEDLSAKEMSDFSIISANTIIETY